MLAVNMNCILRNAAEVELSEEEQAHMASLGESQFLGRERGPRSFSPGSQWLVGVESSSKIQNMLHHVVLAQSLRWQFFSTLA